MTLGSELLNLRRNKTSTVSILLSGIERLDAAKSPMVSMTRKFALNDLSDAVLTNVAVHAVEAYWGDTPVPKTRRSQPSPRRTHRRFGSNFSSNQRTLFA